jgi:hypothetical protein
MDIKMSLAKQYIRFCTSADGRGEESPTQRQFTKDLGDSIGWRGALASGGGSFRKNGTYDTFADSRRNRRSIERSVAKAIRRGKL